VDLTAELGPPRRVRLRYVRTFEHIGAPTQGIIVVLNQSGSKGFHWYSVAFGQSAAGVPDRLWSIDDFVRVLEH